MCKICAKMCKYVHHIIPPPAEPLDDLSCLTTPGLALPGGGGVLDCVGKGCGGFSEVVEGFQKLWRLSRVMEGHGSPRIAEVCRQFLSGALYKLWRAVGGCGSFLGESCHAGHAPGKMLDLNAPDQRCPRGQLGNSSLSSGALTGKGIPLIYTTGRLVQGSGVVQADPPGVAPVTEAADRRTGVGGG